MTGTPDGVEVVETREQAQGLSSPPLLIVDAVREFLDAHQIGAGPIEWDRIGAGQSNITYLIRRGDECVVLRRGPRPPLPRSTHDMVREARIQAALGAAGAAVPRILALEPTGDVLGVPFYVMEYLDGWVITDEVPAGLDAPADRRATAFAAVDALVELHSVDIAAPELASIGRPNGYLERQVRRFSDLWEQHAARDLPDVSRLGRRLAASVPVSTRSSVVHGDFRLGNIMFRPHAPATVLAILDWEMATLGDPLADLGYLTATYAEPGRLPTPLELTSVTREPGYPSADELAERYGGALAVDLAALPWYQALALWKAAIFCEEIYTRWRRGERPGDEFAPTLEVGVPRLVEAATEYAAQVRTK